MLSYFFLIEENMKNSKNFEKIERNFPVQNLNSFDDRKKKAKNSEKLRHVRQTLTSLTSSCVELSTSWKIQHTSNSFSETFTQTHSKSLETSEQKSSKETKSEGTANPAELKIKITLEKTKLKHSSNVQKEFSWSNELLVRRQRNIQQRRRDEHGMKFSWIHFTFIASGKCCCT